MMNRCLVTLLMIATLCTTSLPGRAEDKKDNVDNVGDRNVAHKSIISQEKEIAIGKQYADEIDKQAKILKDPVVNEYVNRVARTWPIHWIKLSANCRVERIRSSISPFSGEAASPARRGPISPRSATGPAIVDFARFWPAPPPERSRSAPQDFATARWKHAAPASARFASDRSAAIGETARVPSRRRDQGEMDGQRGAFSRLQSDLAPPSVGAAGLQMERLRAANSISHGCFP